MSSSTDNLMILTNYTQGRFIDNAPTVCAFLDIEGAFDNVIPSILVEDLFQLSIPAKIRKFVYNLAAERKISFICDGELRDPWIFFQGHSTGLHA